jgi:hypothetical protein
MRSVNRPSSMVDERKIRPSARTASTMASLTAFVRSRSYPRGRPAKGDDGQVRLRAHLEAKRPRLVVEVARQQQLFLQRGAEGRGAR